jgi:translocating chain-associated membrane protein 1
MVVKGRRSSNKNPPILSHEFVIQNHADIVACVAMVFVVGLMFQVSAPFASLFIALHHNATVPVPVGDGGRTVDLVYYTAGPKDLAATFFYLLIAVVMHQIVQEYVLDKVNRKLHLSKVKHAKFNESGQLLAFYAASLVWAADLVLRENLLNIRLLWEGYPHLHMTFMFKFFYVVQLAYWLHVLPELYFQKVKREDMPARVQYAVLYLAFVGGAYVFSYTRLALCLLVLQYLTEAVFHACRLLSYLEKADVARPLYRLHDVLFVTARLGSISLAVLTVWYGLALAPADRQVLDPAAGNFNTAAFRLAALAAVGLLQAWLMWNFITFHLRRVREGKAAAATALAAAKSKKSQQDKAKARKEKGGSKSDENAAEDEELPEVDQNTKKTLRQRK